MGVIINEMNTTLRMQGYQWYLNNVQSTRQNLSYFQAAALVMGVSGGAGGNSIMMGMAAKIASVLFSPVSTSNETVAQAGQGDPPNRKLFSNIKTDYNYVTRKWNLVDALYIPDEGTRVIDVCGNSDNHVMETTTKTLIESGVSLTIFAISTAVPLLRVINAMVVISCRTQYVISSEVMNSYIEEGAGLGIYAINVESLGSSCRAAIFAANTGNFLGWHYTSINGAPLMKHYYYQQFINGY